MLYFYQKGFSHFQIVSDNLLPNLPEFFVHRYTRSYSSLDNLQRFRNSITISTTSPRLYWKPLIFYAHHPISGSLNLEGTRKLLLGIQEMASFLKQTEAKEMSSSYQCFNNTTKLSRPGLARSRTTQASLSIPGVIQASFVSPLSSLKATDLLSKVALISPPVSAGASEITPREFRGQAREYCVILDGTGNDWHGGKIISNPIVTPTCSYESRSEPERDRVSAENGSYFSFPDFDDWAQP